MTDYKLFTHNISVFDRSDKVIEFVHTGCTALAETQQYITLSIFPLYNTREIICFAPGYTIEIEPAVSLLANKFLIIQRNTERHDRGLILECELVTGDNHEIDLEVACQK